MNLSSSYIQPIENPELELICTVYNINVGNNKKFLKKCSVLNEYMIFVNMVRNYLDNGLTIEEALDTTIEECKKQDVLKEFLETRGNEVKHVAALDYTFERREALIRKEEHEDGLKEGITQGIAQGITIFIRDKLDDGIKKEIIIHKLKKMYSITEDEAISYYEDTIKHTQIN